MMSSRGNSLCSLTASIRVDTCCNHASAGPSEGNCNRTGNVLISAMTFGGYLAVKWAGPRLGLLVTGFLGGMTSSTAVSVAMSRLSRGGQALEPISAAAALAGSTVMYLRVLGLCAVFSPALAWRLATPLCAMAVASLVVLAGWFWLKRAQPLALQWDRASQNELLRYSARSHPDLLFQQVILRSDYLFIGALLGSTALGHYAMASAAAELLLIVPEAVTTPQARCSAVRCASLL